jgi:hypothetical protein
MPTLPGNGVAAMICPLYPGWTSGFQLPPINEKVATSKSRGSSDSGSLSEVRTARVDVLKLNVNIVDPKSSSWRARKTPQDGTACHWVRCFSRSILTERLVAPKMGASRAPASGPNGEALMQYTNRTITVSQSRIVEAEGRVARQRRVVERLGNDRHPADHAVALLLVMEQSLLSMKRFLATLERDLERSLGVGKPSRKKAARHRTDESTDQVARQVVKALRSGGIDTDQVAVSASPEPRASEPRSNGWQDEVELPVGKQDQESAAQVADEFAALAVKIVLNENPDLPVLSVIAKVRPQPPRPDTARDAASAQRRSCFTMRRRRDAEAR